MTRTIAQHCTKREMKVIFNYKTGVYMYAPTNMVYLVSFIKAIFFIMATRSNGYDHKETYPGS